MSRRVASHYLLIIPTELSASERAIVDAARQLLPTLPAEKTEAICHDSRLLHPYPPAPFRPTAPQSDAPTACIGFAGCCIGLDDNGTLQSLTRFDGETESTEWYPGALVFPDRCHTH